MRNLHTTAPTHMRELTIWEKRCVAWWHENRGIRRFALRTNRKSMGILMNQYGPWEKATVEQEAWGDNWRRATDIRDWSRRKTTEQIQAIIDTIHFEILPGLG